MKLKMRSTETSRVYRLAQLKVNEIISSLRVKAYESSSPTKAGEIEVSSIAHPIDRTLMQKLSMVNLKANQLSNAYLVIREPLFISILRICASKNSDST